MEFIKITNQAAQLMYLINYLVGKKVVIFRT